MWLVFADDSEVPDKHVRRPLLGHLVGVGAVMLPEEKLTTYSEGVDKLRTELGVPPDCELKWSPRDGSWLKSNSGKAVRADLFKRVLALAAESEVRSVVVVVDRARIPGWDLPHTRGIALRYLYDKVSINLKTAGRQNDQEPRGLIIADEPGGGPVQQRSWLTNTRPLTDAGTEYTPPDKIVLPIVTAPSDHVPHLQLADLVTAATVAAVAGNTYGLELLPALRKLACTYRGLIGGAGLTLWPRNELSNLYYWLCEDERFPGPNGALFGLPRAGDYEHDDGLTTEAPSSKAST